MFGSVKEIRDKEIESGKSFWEIVCDEDCHEESITREEAFSKMREMYLAMKASYRDYDKDAHSNSGLVGSDGYKAQKAHEEGAFLAGDFVGAVMEKAIKIGESNACMKPIVAAPTAGSCGVLPAVLITYEEKTGTDEDRIVEALFVAGGIGGVIASRAFLAGAAGGCQAEIGAASAMAAGSLAYLRGGNGEDIANAAALAMKNLLGLACDPVAGLVEVPCVKRNVIGAVNAVTSSDLTLAGIKTKIPFDEVVDAMKAIGKSMDKDIRETGRGGLAATPSGEKIKTKMSLM